MLQVYCKIEMTQTYWNFPYPSCFSCYFKHQPHERVLRARNRHGVSRWSGTSFVFQRSAGFAPYWPLLLHGRIYRRSVQHTQYDLLFLHLSQDLYHFNSLCESLHVQIYVLLSECHKFCDNGGTCTYNYQTHRAECRCPLSFTGDRCEIGMCCSFNPTPIRFYRNTCTCLYTNMN